MLQLATQNETPMNAPLRVMVFEVVVEVTSGQTVNVF